MGVPGGWPAGLVWVRHGQSVGNVADARARASSSEVVDVGERDADVPLSALGHRQARAVGRWLAADADAPPLPEVVVTSPYRRARATAEAVVAALGEAGHDPGRLRTDERLRERDLGWWDGLTGAGVRARYPEEAARRDHLGKLYYRPPGGESWCDVALRVRSLLRDLRAEHAGRHVLLVSHQAVVMNARMVLEDLDEEEVLRLDRDEPLANCSVTAYRAGPDGPVLDVAGDTTAVADVADLAVTDDEVDDEPDDAPAGASGAAR
ncbi:histidine phosphatase family protein [Kineococcus sp. SYSU DK004]|uniref:histidine phosphatase family protein n=1 Tax=Kineococcus sp. SYSU DK004 TaxID=3383125 RepID=UPI003D7EF19C